MNVILIVIDALRSDHLGICGYSRDTTPNIDRIARESAFFSTAICTLPRTTPSLASIFTGLYPHSHGMRFEYSDKLPLNVTRLPEILQAHGYKTIGNAIETRDAEFEKGFSSYNPIGWRILNKVKRTLNKTVKWDYHADPTETMTNFGLSRIKALKNQKFFLYLHYLGPHWPYQPPKPYDEIFDPYYKGNHNFNRITDTISRGDLIFNNPLPKSELEHSIAHYDGAIRYVDHEVNKIFKALDQFDLAKDTLLVITSDHGECFGEHGMYFQHGEYLYEEAIRAPLIIRHPKIPAKKIHTQVQLTDIMPTILDFLGIPLIEHIDGVSLMPLINENVKVREYTFCEMGRNLFKQNKRIYFDGLKGKWRAIRTDEWKLIFIPHPGNDIYELYNLAQDPEEKNNLIGKETKVEDALKKELLNWIKKGTNEEVDTDLTEKSKKLLRKLGYMD